MNRLEEAQTVGIAQVDSILDTIEHHTLEEHPIDAFLIAQGNAERNNPPIVLEDETDNDDESQEEEMIQLTPEQEREFIILHDRRAGVYGSASILAKQNARAARQKDFERWEKWMQKGWFKRVEQDTRSNVFYDWKKSMEKRNWDRIYLEHRFDSDILRRDSLNSDARNRHEQEKAFRKAFQEEHAKQRRAFHAFMLKNAPLDQAISVVFRFVGYKTKKTIEKTYEISRNVFEHDWWHQVPLLRDLFVGMVYFNDGETEEQRAEFEEIRAQLSASFFPIRFEISPDLPVLPKAVEAYIYYIETGEYHDDTHLLTATVAEALGDLEFGKKMMMDTDPMFYTVDSLQFMTPSMKESFIRSYLDACFKTNLSGMDWKVRKWHMRQIKIAEKYGVNDAYFHQYSKHMDTTPGGFRARLRKFFTMKPDIAQFIFENHRKLFESYFRVPNRQNKRYSQIKTFDDLIAFIDEADMIAEGKSAGGSEVILLARKDPKIAAMYKKYNKLLNRNRRYDCMDESASEGGMKPQEREDALREQIAQAEKRFISQYNQNRTQKAVKDPIMAAKAACSSRRGR